MWPIEDGDEMTDANIVEFAKWVIREGCWENFMLEWDEIQDKAERLGLIVKTKYDPKIHGPSEHDVQPGEDWYVFAPRLAMPFGGVNEQAGQSALAEPGD